MTSTDNNKRIAKNTLFLYFRSIITLGIGLYTSRVVLGQLGLSDYGVYNVVGSVIVLFSFLQNAMSNATSRFFTFDLGTGDFEKLKKTFNLSVVIHIFTAFIILILGETIGLWFLNTQLVIPAERMGTANFVYQLSIISTCIGIMQTPYVVTISAHERMKVFAYAGLADSVLRLVVALALGFAAFDKLGFFAFLLLLVYLIMTLFYQIYCHRNFPETHFKWFWDKKMFWERMAFSGWTTFGGISAVAAIQGVNMLLNVFHGVVVNAAFAVMQQVSNTVVQFTNNITTAISPQITKSYAKNDFDYLHSLIFRSVKFMYFLVFALSIPLILNMDFILSLWLKTVPPFAVVLCQWILVYNLICTFNNAINISIIATAKIKKLQIMAFVFSASNFITIYFLFKNGFSPQIIPVVYSIIAVLGIIFSFYLAKSYIRFPLIKFCKDILVKIVLVTCIVLPLPFALSFYFKGWQNLLLTVGAFFILYIPCVFLIGLSTSERNFLIQKIMTLLQYKNN